MRRDSDEPLFGITPYGWGAVLLAVAAGVAADLGLLVLSGALVAAVLYLEYRAYRALRQPGR